MSKPHLEMWTVYESPSDYPGKFVVRKHYAGVGEQFVAVLPTAVVDSLEAARSHIPSGLHCLGREPEDDSVIVETWI